MEKPKENKKAFLTIRCDPEVKEQLKALAEEQERTMSQQVVWLIKQALKDSGKLILIALPFVRPP